MENVNVTVNELIEILKKNRDIHQQEYTEAMGGYRMEAESELKKRLKLIKSGEKFDLYFKLREPVSYAKDYEDAIGMLQITNSPFVSISMKEYLEYYKNEWDWSRSWHIENSGYATLYNVAGVGKVKSKTDTAN